MKVCKIIIICLILIIIIIIKPKEVYNAETLFSKKIDMIDKISEHYNIDAEFVIAIIMTESSFRHNVIKIENVVNENAYGLGQVLLSTARIYDKEIKASDLLIPEKNIEITIRHIAMLSDKHNGNIEKITREYNGGTRKKNNRGYYLKVKKYYDKLNLACDNGGKK